MPDTSDELDAIVERFRKQCVSKTNTGNGFESTKADLLKWRDKAIRAEMLSIIGEDVPITVNGKAINMGETLEIDLSGGLDDPVFQESCKNIQENGKNLEKGRIKQQVISRYGAEDGQL